MGNQNATPRQGISQRHTWTTKIQTKREEEKNLNIHRNNLFN